MKGMTWYRIALFLAGILCITNTPAFAEEGVQYLPLAQYDVLSLDEQTIHSPGAGLAVLGENLMFVGLYTQHLFDEPLRFDYPETYHSIELLMDGKAGRHQYLLAFSSKSDEPVAGGLRTFQAAAVYGYEVLHGPNLSLALGGGLAVSDFGIELPDGTAWPLLPVPFVRIAWESRLLDAAFSFITGPNVSLTLAPESRIRLTGEFRMDQFRDIRDLIFEAALVYRIFSEDHPMGDFAGVSAGVMNQEYGFDLAGKDETLEIRSYALFGRIDLSLLKITGGYAFEAEERYREEDAIDMGDGFFLSLQAMFPL